MTEQPTKLCLPCSSAAQGATELGKPKVQKRTQFADTAERMAICRACPHNMENRFCNKAEQPLLHIVTGTLKIDCPLGKHPDKDGKVKYIGLTFNGVPDPIRRLVDREAETKNAKSWVRFFKGCGCLSAIKEKTEIWSSQGKFKRLIAQAIEVSAPKLSQVLSYIIDWRIRFARKFHRKLVGFDQSKSRFKFESKFNPNLKPRELNPITK